MLTNKKSAHSSDISRAFKLSLPIFFAYFPLGIVFGILFAQSGFTWYLAPIMSALVYGGSVQFVALSMMTQHAAIYAIILATVFIAFRNSFYGLSFLNRFGNNPLIKSLLIFLLVDATYVILAANPPRGEEGNDLSFCLWLSLFIYIPWVIGTLIGAACAELLPPIPALSFILPAFFMALVVDYFMAKRTWQAIVVPIICVIVAYCIAPSQYLLLAILLSLLFIIASHYLTRRSANR